MTKRAKTPGETAREAAGYTLESAARALGYKGTRRWHEIERHGGAPMHIAERAGRLFQCSGNVFFFSTRAKRKTKRKRKTK